MSKTANTPATRAMPLDARVAIQGLVGKKCWLVAFGYGPELHLHLGARIPYEYPKMAGKKHGSWRLGTCGTSWTILTPNGSVCSREHDERTLEQKAKVL